MPASPSSRQPVVPCPVPARPHPNERRWPLAVAAFAGGLAVTIAIARALGVHGVLGDWDLVVAAGAVVTAIVAGRVARRLPVGDAPEDPVAVPDAADGIPPVEARSGSRVVVAVLVGFVTLSLGTGLALAVLSSHARTLFGGGTFDVAGQPAVRFVDPGGSVGLIRDRPLRPFRFAPEPARHQPSTRRAP